VAAYQVKILNDLKSKPRLDDICKILANGLVVISSCYRVHSKLPIT